MINDGNLEMLGEELVLSPTGLKKINIQNICKIYFHLVALNLKFNFRSIFICKTSNTKIFYHHKSQYYYTMYSYNNCE